MGQRDILSVGFRLIGVMETVRGLAACGVIAVGAMKGAPAGMEFSVFLGLIHVLLGCGLLLSADFLAYWLTDEQAEEMEFAGQWRWVSRDGFRFVLRVLGAYVLCVRVLPSALGYVGAAYLQKQWGLQAIREHPEFFLPLLLQLALAIYLLRGADFLVYLAWKKDLLRFPTIAADNEKDVEE